MSDTNQMKLQKDKTISETVPTRSATNDESEVATPEEVSIYHDRANHEDNLHVNRTLVFISFNGFIAVAVGLPASRGAKLIFLVMVLLVDFLWAMWAKNAVTYIRALREAGISRPDEQLRQKQIVPRERRIFSPLLITSRGIPWLFFGGWLAMLVYLILM